MSASRAASRPRAPLCEICECRRVWLCSAPSRAREGDTETLDWIRRVAAGARKVTTVCTGSLLLARAGLLEGRHATTHWGALDTLDSLKAGVTVEREYRVVDDGVISSAGVASGIDMAFYVVETLFGREVADETAHYIEYRRDGKPALRV